MSTNGKASKLDRNREKVIQDRLQLLLTRMLQDEDNKYCVDCDSKGPRWASWNLGIFLCIRCAGIHRNLGVHISKVKSVNLDSWTQIQVSSMQQMGNSRGRAVYEARLPEDFRRPQSDQQMDTFIRSKYEKKKYIALEWTPSKPPDLPQGWAEIIEAEKQKKDIRSIVLPSRASNSPNDGVKANNAPQSNVPEPTKSSKENTSPTLNSSVKAQIPKAATTSAAFDLLGLNSTNTETTSNILKSASVNQNVQKDAVKTSTDISSNLDLLCIGESTKSTNDNDFDDFVRAPVTSNIGNTNGSNNNGQFISNSNDLEQLGTAFGSSNPSTGEKENAGVMSKDSIMALFNKPQSNTTAAAPNVMQINTNGVGPQAFSSFPSNLQTQNTPFSMNMTGGVGVTGLLPNATSNSVSLGGINFQQQTPIGNYTGQQQPPAISNLNNPFLNMSSPAVNSSSASNSNQASWGFMN